MTFRVSVRMLARSFAAMLVVLLCGYAGMAQSIKIPPHEKVVLKNGLTVLLLEKHGVPIVSIAALIKGGATADPAGQEGLAAQTAALLRKGYEETLGATVRGGSGFHWRLVRSRCGR